MVAWAITDTTASDVVIENCAATYSGTGATFGGGVYLADSTAVWRRVVLRRNTGGRGGGLYIRCESPRACSGWHGVGRLSPRPLSVRVCIAPGSDASTFVDATIAANTGEHEGAGVACTEDASTTFRSCNVSGNVAPSGGALYAQSVSRCSLVESVLADNEATDFTGGAVSVVETAVVRVDGGVLSGNKAEERGGAAFVAGSGQLLLTGTGLLVGNRGALIGVCAPRYSP